MNSSGTLSRRKLLQGTLSASTLIVFGHWLPMPLAFANDQSNFAKLSLFLTGRQVLPVDYVEAIHQALKQQNPDFPLELDHLSQALNKSLATNVAMFMTPLNNSDPHRKTALLIIESFYTGNVGRGPTAIAVAYESALMFDATQDVTVIPSYLREQPNYWQQTPNLDV